MNRAIRCSFNYGFYKQFKSKIFLFFLRIQFLFNFQQLLSLQKFLFREFLHYQICLYRVYLLRNILYIIKIDPFYVLNIFKLKAYLIGPKISKKIDNYAQDEYMRYLPM